MKHLFIILVRISITLGSRFSLLINKFLIVIINICVINIVACHIVVAIYVAIVLVAHMHHYV